MQCYAEEKLQENLHENTVSVPSNIFLFTRLIIRSARTSQTEFHLFSHLSQLTHYHLAALRMKAHVSHTDSNFLLLICFDDDNEREIQKFFFLAQ